MKKIILLAVFIIGMVISADAQTPLTATDTIKWDSIPAAVKVELLKSANAGNFNDTVSLKIVDIVSVTYVTGIPKTRSTDPNDKNQVWIQYTDINSETINILASTKKNETVTVGSDVIVNWCRGDGIDKIIPHK